MYKVPLKLWRHYRFGEYEDWLDGHMIRQRLLLLPVMEWLADMDLEYEFVHEWAYEHDLCETIRYVRSFLRFQKVSDATLFKLTWH